MLLCSFEFEEGVGCFCLDKSIDCIALKKHKALDDLDPFDFSGRNYSFQTIFFSPLTVLC
jgi:hypothetical protein